MAKVSFKHLVAAVDLHKSADHAIVDSVVEHAISLALAYSARVTLLHVVQDDSMALLGVDTPAMAPTYDALVEGVEQRRADIGGQASQGAVVKALLEARQRGEIDGIHGRLGE